MKPYFICFIFYYFIITNFHIGHFEKKIQLWLQYDNNCFYQIVKKIFLPFRQIAIKEVYCREVIHTFFLLFNAACNSSRWVLSLKERL